MNFEGKECKMCVYMWAAAASLMSGRLLTYCEYIECYLSVMRRHE
jgi:hypothetical protein